MKRSKTDERVLWHQSGVNRDGEPFVQLMFDDEVICQLDSQQARDHARNLLEATEAAEQDAFLLDFAKGTIGTTEEGAIMLLQEFRKFREQRGKKGPVSDPAEFMLTAKHERPDDKAK